MCIHTYSAVLFLGIYLTNQSKYRCKYLCVNTVNKELFLLMKPERICISNQRQLVKQVMDYSQYGILLNH